MANTPIITIGTPNKTKISRVEGYDRAVVTFTSDMTLLKWEARATIPGVTPGKGVGLLVESGSTLSANTEATIYVDDEELTNGDNEYTITVYGINVINQWSDGTYEKVNLIDFDTIWYNWGSLVNDVFMFDTENLNTDLEGMRFKIQTWFNDDYVQQILTLDTSEIGDNSVSFVKTNGINSLRIGTNGDIADASAWIDISDYKNGSTYLISFTLDELTLNTAVMKNLIIAEVVE